MDNLPPLPLTLNYNNPYRSFNKENYKDNFSYEHFNQFSFDYFEFDSNNLNEPDDSYDSYESDDEYDLDF